jgi:hypothetical protein
MSASCAGFSGPMGPAPYTVGGTIIGLGFWAWPGSKLPHK